jgi:hypothetical protein
MSKKYRLIKDIFDANRGTEFVFDGNYGYAYKTMYGKTRYATPESVEGNNTWFQEIKEPEPSTQQEKEVFTWEEIVSVIKSQCDGTYSEDRYNWNFVGADAPAKLMAALLQSKQPSPPKEAITPKDVIGCFNETGMAGEPNVRIWKHNIEKQAQPSKTKERVWVGRFRTHDNFKGNGFDSFWYQFCSSQPIPEEWFPLIKQKIESAINADNEICFGAKWHKENFFTKQQMDEEREKAFNAGRSRIGGFWNDHITNWTYNSFNHFKNNLK